MPLFDLIQKDFEQALKQKDLNVISTLRLLLAALKNARIEKRADLEDEDIIKVLKSELKKRKESIIEFEKGQREDLATKEKTELAILEKYLPQQMSEAEITKKVMQILAQAPDKDNIGKVMGQVMAELKGQADGSLVRKIVEAQLQK